MNRIAIIFPLLFIATPLVFADSSNVGTIYWKQDVVSSNSFVDIYVTDDDMNKKEYPNFADKFTITVWSDTSPDGLEIQVLENGVYSGIFKGTVYIADSGDAEKIDWYLIRAMCYTQNMLISHCLEVALLKLSLQQL